MLSWVWPSEPAAARPRPPTPVTPPRKRSMVPTPFPSPIHKPHCDLCAQAVASHRDPPCAPSPRRISTRGRRRQVDTSRHFCPDPDCRYGGWLGLGNIHANGLPTICQPEFVTLFTPAALPVHDASGWHHSTYDDAAWPPGYGGVGRQYGVRPGHAAVPSPATPHTRR